MRRISVFLVSVLTALALTSAPSLAAAFGVPQEPTSVDQKGGLHFVGEPTVQLNNSSAGVYLLALGEVAGAGPGAYATLTANVETVTGCINPSNQDPGQQPKGLDRTNSTVSGSGLLQTDEGGKTYYSVATAPAIPIEPPARDCPGKADMEPVLVSITFTDIKLVVTSAKKTLTAYYADIVAYP